MFSGNHYLTGWIRGVSGCSSQVVPSYLPSQNKKTVPLWLQHSRGAPAAASAPDHSLPPPTTPTHQATYSPWGKVAPRGSDLSYSKGSIRKLAFSTSQPWPPPGIHVILSLLAPLGASFYPPLCARLLWDPSVLCPSPLMPPYQSWPLPTPPGAAAGAAGS